MIVIVVGDCMLIRISLDVARRPVLSDILVSRCRSWSCLSIVIIFCGTPLALCVRRGEVSASGLFLCCGVNIVECSTGAVS